MVWSSARAGSRAAPTTRSSSCGRWTRPTSPRNCAGPFERHAPDGVALDDLQVLGPIFVLKLRQVPRIVERKLVAELWLYPDDSRILELSAKSPPSEAFDLAARLRAYLCDRGIDTGGEQATKTRRALELLAG